jgi:hypothetical protein
MSGHVAGQPQPNELVTAKNLIYYLLVDTSKESKDDDESSEQHLLEGEKKRKDLDPCRHLVESANTTQS